MVQGEEIQFPSTLQLEKPVSLGLLLFSTNTMDTEALQQSITKSIQDVLVGLWWKMVSLGVQGQVKPEDQVRALHIYVDEMDAVMAKWICIPVGPVKCMISHSMFDCIWFQSWTQF